MESAQRSPSVSRTPPEGETCASPAVSVVNRSWSVIVSSFRRRAEEEGAGGHGTRPREDAGSAQEGRQPAVRWIRGGSRAGHQPNLASRWTASQVDRDEG